MTSAQHAVKEVSKRFVWSGGATGKLKAEVRCESKFTTELKGQMVRPEIRRILIFKGVAILHGVPRLQWPEW